MVGDCQGRSEVKHPSRPGAVMPQEKSYHQKAVESEWQDNRFDVQERKHHEPDPDLVQDQIGSNSKGHGPATDGAHAVRDVRQEESFLDHGAIEEV